jgi:ketosteroid isomerase-like protein
MTQDNVQVIREVMQAFNERDESVLGYYAEDVEYRLIGGFADLMGPTINGREAVLAFAYELVDNLGARFEVEQLRDVDGRVLLIANTEGAGEESGAPVTRRWGQIYTFRDGKIATVDNYWDAEEALAAAGLS